MTTTTKRITKTDRFNEIKAILATLDRTDLIDFVDHEIELIANKNKSASGAKKLTATQTANMGIKADILNYMEVGKRYTCSDFIKNVPSLEGASTSKVSALLRQMRNDVENGSGEIVRFEEKGKTYFALA